MNNPRAAYNEARLNVEISKAAFRKGMKGWEALSPQPADLESPEGEAWLDASIAEQERLDEVTEMSARYDALRAAERNLIQWLAAELAPTIANLPKAQGSDLSHMFANYQYHPKVQRRLVEMALQYAKGRLAA